MTWKFGIMSSCVHHFKAIGEFKLELRSRNTQFGSKLVIFLSPVTSKCDGWPWKTIGNIFFATSSFVLHFIAIYQFKMELQSRNGEFGSKSAIICPVWPWDLTDDLGKKGHLFYATPSFVYHFIAICEIKVKLQSGNTKFGSKSAIFCPAWPWNLTDDIEKQ